MGDGDLLIIIINKIDIFQNDFETELQISQQIATGCIKYDYNDNHVLSFPIRIIGNHDISA